MSKYGLEVLTQLLQFSDDHSNNASWIRDTVDQYMLDKGQFTIESLPSDELDELIEVVKKNFSDRELELPDYLKTSEELPVTDNVDLVQKLESDLAKANAELATSNKKLEVAKDFIKQMDTKLGKFESIGADDLVALLADYESIGTPEDIQKAIDQIPELKAKVEELIAEKEAKETPKEGADNPDETTKPENSSGENSGNSEEVKPIPESSECSGENNSTSDGSGTPSEDPDDSANNGNLKGENMDNTENKANDDQLELLKRYQALGTPEELAELMDKASKTVDVNSELTEKVESMSSRLSKYESIGEVDEVAQVVEEYGQMKINADADRIAAELSIPKEKVLATIERVGSVAAAEELLTDLFPKADPTETKTENDGEQVAKVQPTDAQGPDLIEKTESARVVLGAPKHESAIVAHKSRLDNLRKICGRL